ncbi:MAG: SUMF1/EgtB/PvdO family nonheme iron enzyme [Candidatus Electrothrix communis]|nr:MAG: SUMF1/EgtB/PvdO family nonheme iron enzyme [Candidatus Electrothrix communis]
MKKNIPTSARIAVFLVFLGFLIYAGINRAAWWSKFLSIFSADTSTALQGFEVVVNLGLLVLGGSVLWFFGKPLAQFLEGKEQAKHPEKTFTEREIEKFYHDNLLKECERYDFGDLDEERAEDHSGLKLSDVYVDQQVTVFDPKQKNDPSEQKELAERKTIPLFQALEKYSENHCIISGIVGSGKSSFINFLAADIIRSFASEQSSVLPGDFTRRPVVRVRLREIGATLDRSVDADGLLLRHIRTQVHRHIVFGCNGTNGVYDVSDCTIEQYCNELVTELQKNGIILLDGLDEVTLTEDKRLMVQQAIRHFLDRLPENSSCRLILTSRPPGLTGNSGERYQPPGFVRLELQSMSLQQAGTFIHHWYEKKAKADPRPSTNDPMNRQRAEHLIMQVSERPSLEELTGTPMLLTLMLLVDSGNYRLPESRAELYDRAVKLLLQRWHLNLRKDVDSFEPEAQAVMEAMTEDGGFAKDLREALSRTALESYQHAEATAAEKNATITFSQALVLGNISLFLDNSKRTSEKTIASAIDSTAIHNFLQNRSNILVGAGESDDRLQFVHKSFHEYLAAESYHFDDNSRTAVAKLLADPKKRDWWREVLLFWMNARSIVELKDFIRPLLLEPFGEMEKEKLENHAAAVVLCCEAALEKNLRRYADSGRNPELNTLFNEAQQKLLRLMEDMRVAVSLRAQTGRLLGELGDPRPGITVWEDDSGRPDIAWVEIPAAQGFMMGSEAENARDNEKPLHSVDVDAFGISRSPITNAQYRCFIEAGGYEKSQYWQSEGARQWLTGGNDEKLLEGISDKNTRKLYRNWLTGDTERRAPRFWHDRRWNNPNHPVVGVSWFEALAFCCWLAEVEGKPVRLPGEEEWEYAARGVKGLKYSWGDEFAESLGNTKKTGLERTSAVGLFVPGRAVGPQAESEAFGLHDMTGNVWEWTVNRWGKNFGKTEFAYADWQKRSREEREDPNVNELRVIRGGSWLNVPNYARCSFRGWYLPISRLNGLGFRVVFSLAAF